MGARGGTDVLSRSLRRAGGDEQSDVFDAPVESVRTRETASLELPATRVRIERLGDEATYHLTAGAQVPSGEYHLECLFDPRTEPTVSDRGIATHVRFEGRATVEPHDERVEVSLPEPREVHVGFERPAHDDIAQVGVPMTPAGVATALTHSAAALHTTGPARSHPAMREHPPLIEPSETVSIPDAVRDRTPETGIELRLPERFDALFVAAPLAYYLGATVTVEAGGEPTVLAPEVSLEHHLGSMPDLQESCADLFRKTFFLDCLVRDVDAAIPASRTTLPSQLDLQPELLRSMSPAERLDAYLSIPDGLVRSNMPDWHLSTYAEPEPGRVPCLPYLLDSLSLVYRPEATVLDETDLLDRTLEDTYRGPGDVRSVEMLEPELHAGRAHAWLAPGTPIGTFKTTLSAYENRAEYAAGRSDSLDVTVVLNDDEMCDERAAAAEIYRERAEDLPIDLAVAESLTCTQLRGVFESRNDFVHYIGHCEESGLRCQDGHLAIADIDGSRTRTFFLNACGSYHEGLQLVEQGSIAGAVTLRSVLDSHAAKVGTAFAQLLVHGFGIQRALTLARRRILMSKDYAVVGDGTYSLLPVGEPGVLRLERDGEQFGVAYERLAASSYGENYSSPVDDTTRLHGNVSTGELTEPELVALLERTSLPVIYDGQFDWSDGLAARLGDE